MTNSVGGMCSTIKGKLIGASGGQTSVRTVELEMVKGKRIGGVGMTNGLGS